MPQKNLVTYDRVPLDKLHFDPTNPRFHTTGAAPTEPKIQQLLEKAPHLALELVDSFLENGYIDYEPLVVKRRDDSEFTVVEGNRRLAALRHIKANPDKFSGRDQRLADLVNIPVLVFPDAAGPQEAKEQRVYLGVRHLFGYREWPAESKARFLDQLIRTPEDLERTMRELNIKRSEISRYLVPLRLRKEAKDLWEPHKEQDFWSLGEGLNRSGVKEYIALDVDRKTLRVKSFSRPKLNSLFRMIYGSPSKDRADKVINETRDLTMLGKILENEKATEKLEKGATLAEASVELESTDETLERLKRLVSELGVVVGKLRKRAKSGPLVRSFDSLKKSSREFLKNG